MHRWLWKDDIITKLYSYEEEVAISIKLINAFAIESAISFLGIYIHLCKMQCLQDYNLQYLGSS